ncbi:hypothetical protein C5S39_02095 [Candidatus Methanophagaceae archaeon]|jgi:hypothetical protein|nr:hypothetical protein C5S39_02095 [Methanophagales archaeon]
MAYIKQSAVCWNQTNPPKFDFQFGGVIDNDNPIYEVTEELAYIGSKLGTIEIIVSADYSGNEISGPVNIEIQSDEVDEWAQFQHPNRDSKVFNLTPSDLFNYSGVPARVAALNLTQSDSPAATSGQFKIEVVRNEVELGNKKVTVVHTPWVHSTQLSDSTILAGENITAYVTVKNCGAPSKFNVVGLLYETTSTNSSTFVIGSEGWWPEKTWGDIRHRTDQKTDKIDNNTERIVPLSIPGDKFEAQHTYILETYAIKELPYLHPKKDWPNCWEVRDPPHYSTIVVLEP